MELVDVFLQASLSGGLRRSTFFWRYLVLLGNWILLLNAGVTADNYSWVQACVDVQLVNSLRKPGRRVDPRISTVFAVVVSLFATIPVLGQANSGNSAAAVEPVRAEIITLERAIALADQHNYQLNISRDEIPRVDKLIAAARTEGLPKFKALTFPSQELTPPGQGNFGFIGLAMQPLTQLYRVGVAENLVRLERNLAKQAVRLKRQESINAVKLTYYSVSQREDAIRSVEDQIRYLKELAHFVEGQVVNGAALDVDLLEVRTRLAAAEFEAQNLRDLIATNKEQLNHLMGRDPRLPFGIVEISPPDATEIDMSSAESLALKQRPELHEQQIRVQKILAERKLVLSRYIPDVSVGFTSIQSYHFDKTLPKNFVGVGFSASYDVYDWSRKIYLAEADHIRSQQERLRLSDIIDQVLIDVRDKCRLVRLARQRLGVARMLRDTATERLRISTKRLQVGSTVFSQVLESEAALANANRQYTDSILAYWSARSELDRATGKDFN